MNSITITAGGVQLTETWQRFYNGPHAGRIDMDLAERDAPWLVGASPSVTLMCPDHCSTASANHSEGEKTDTR